MLSNAPSHVTFICLLVYWFNVLVCLLLTSKFIDLGLFITYCSCIVLPLKYSFSKQTVNRSHSMHEYFVLLVLYCPWWLKSCYWPIADNITATFSDGIKRKTTPLKVTVSPRPHYDVKITDNGFQMKIITIDEGNTINFTWRDCGIPHSIIPLEFCDQHCGFVQKPVRGLVNKLRSVFNTAWIKVYKLKTQKC